MQKAVNVENPAVIRSAGRLARGHDLADGRVWEQYLNVSELNGVQHLDEGNGAQVPAGAGPPAVP